MNHKIFLNMLHQIVLYESRMFVSNFVFGCIEHVCVGFSFSIFDFCFLKWRRFAYIVYHWKI